MGTLVVLRLLRGLHGLSDLHADDVDLCLAVLQHLLSRLEELLVLWRDGKHRRGIRERVKEPAVDGKTNTAGLMSTLVPPLA